MFGISTFLHIQLQWFYGFLCILRGFTESLFFKWDFPVILDGTSYLGILSSIRPTACHNGPTFKPGIWDIFKLQFWTLIAIHNDSKSISMCFTTNNPSRFPMLSTKDSWMGRGCLQKDTFAIEINTKLAQTTLRKYSTVHHWQKYCILPIPVNLPSPTLSRQRISKMQTYNTLTNSRSHFTLASIT